MAEPGFGRSAGDLRTGRLRPRPEPRKPPSDRPAGLDSRRKRWYTVRMFEHRGSAAPSARVSATGPAGAPGRDGALDEVFDEGSDADEEALDRLAAMVPGA